MLTQNGLHPLKDSFRGKFRLGATLSINTLRGQDRLSEVIARWHFDALTAENSMKPENIHPAEGRFAFGEADRLMEIAAQQDALVVGHTLVWHQQTPQWFFTDREGNPASRAQVLDRLRTHITCVVGRYRGRISEWDVLNEVISDKDEEFLRPNSWLHITGEEYISEAFRTAHAADAKATLIYNDYNIERGAKHEKTLRFLKSLREQGVPVHAVGIQGHWSVAEPDLSVIETAIRNFAALGLKVKITELDISVLPPKSEGKGAMATLENNPFTAGLPAEMDAQLAHRYRELFELFLKYREVIDRVTLWGVHDGPSWLNNFPIRGRTDYPLLFDRQGQPKAAFHAVQSVGQEHSETVSKVPVPTAGREVLKVPAGRLPHEPSPAFA
jgi:endo-1,4-beta-xylanase